LPVSQWLTRLANDNLTYHRGTEHAETEPKRFSAFSASLWWIPSSRVYEGVSHEFTQ
jgi:hypothetical protein